MANRKMWQRKPSKKIGGCTYNDADLTVAAAFAPSGLVPTVGEPAVESLADHLAKGESMSDAELIERARRVKDRLSDLYAGGVASADAESFAAVAQAERVIGDMLDRLADPWRSPSEPPEAFAIVWIRVETKNGPKVLWDCSDSGPGRWESSEGRVTGWKPVVRPLP